MKADLHQSITLHPSPDQESPTLGNDVFARLRADIITSRLPPGTKLRLNDLREAYGVGFSPLREALSRLAENRLVTAIGQRGFRVREVSAEDIMDISMVRKEVEAFALRLAIKTGDGLWEAQLVNAGESLAALQKPSCCAINSTGTGASPQRAGCRTHRVGSSTMKSWTQPLRARRTKRSSCSRHI